MKSKLMPMILLIFCEFVFFGSNPVIAQASEPVQTLQWWQVVAGILAIPTTIIGLVYSVFLINKTRFEVQKTKLEIIEKQRELQELGSNPNEVLGDVVNVLLEDRQARFVFLRFVIFYLILMAWELIESGYRWITGVAYMSLTQFFGVGLNDDNIFLLIVTLLIVNLPTITYWIVIIGIGWPLFRDANSIVGLNLKDFFSLRTQTKSLKK